MNLIYSQSEENTCGVVAAANAAIWSGEPAVTYEAALALANLNGLIGVSLVGEGYTGMSCVQVETLMELLGARARRVAEMTVNRAVREARRGHGVVLLYMNEAGRGHAVFLHERDGKVKIANRQNPGFGFKSIRKSVKKLPGGCIAWSVGPKG